MAILNRGRIKKGTIKKGTDGKYPNCPVAAADFRRQSKEQSLVDLDLAAFEFLSQLLHRKPLEPLMAVARGVARARSVDAPKARKTVHAQFAMENVQSVPLELFICHLFQRNHRRISSTSPSHSTPLSLYRS
jgi:hypothetical protein